MIYQSRLNKLYEEEIIPNLIKKFEYSSVMEVPRLKKIILHQGVGSTTLDKKLIDHSMNEITSIVGQKAVFCYSKHDESGFKLRKGMAIGVKVTLRRIKMYEFLERLITVSLPRVRDFNGVKKTSFDGFGNYNMGITEQVIYPEIDIDKIKKNIGMNITFVTSAKSNLEAKSLLFYFGIPFKK
ncbi:50S ribosomal protein L5 [Blattabacterium sp. (Cryptocercus kyebangensis)]|uniref:50S ribosomal protein L5 n=1 Tax=Blattabacterium sp. (Cryptocercus kyebangensis) TaxID=298656 RepID=UPI000D7BE677|nr:50S ribosomal protein L5 [Blattabacterium sp. (Cryptocercus kyebangensis)]AWU43687.1 50S ribosomal protein L5 [Blattabacterium sp. (Cryptocercus kyebangensis)]